MINTIKQQGASLLVALIMLLVLSVLAATSMRGVVQESRVTATRTEQVRLESQSDSATRAAGNLIAARPAALLHCGTPPAQPCLVSTQVATDYKVDGAQFTTYDGSGDGGTSPSKDLASGWYIIPAPSGEAEGQTQNPEYGNRMRGIGTFLYEANAYAHPDGRSSEKIYTRAVFSKTYN